MSQFGASKREGHDSSPFYNRKLYSNVAVKEEVNELENSIPSNILNKILCQDAQNMDDIPDSSVHLIVTSPPYNVGKEYDDNLDLDSYLGLLRNVFSETYRVLVSGGRACINIANVGRRPYIPYHKFIIDVMSETGFLMRGEVIWDKGAGAGTSTAWGSWRSAANPTLRDTHEYILIFSKEKFSRSGRGRQSTITRDGFLEYTKSVWQFPPESATRVGHPAPFPVELPLRCIQLYTFKEDVVLDPFCGVGTTCLSAAKLGRRFIGIDINEEYVQIARTRIEDYLAQSRLSPFLNSSRTPAEKGLVSKKIAMSESKGHFITIPAKFRSKHGLNTNGPVRVLIGDKVFDARIDAHNRLWAKSFSDYLDWEKDKVVFLDKSEDGSIMIKQ